MKTFNQIFALTLMFLTLLGCGDSGGDTPTATTATTEELVLLDVVTLTSETETAIEARPEIFFYNDRFFFVYLYAPTAAPREHRVRIYDAELSTVLGEYTVSATTTAYGSPTDIRGTQVGGQVYLAYETLKAPPDVDKETYVLLAAHSLDASFSPAAPTSDGSVLLASSVGEGPWSEVLADPTVYVKDGSLVLLTGIVTSPTGNAIHYLRELNASDLAIIEPGREINLGDTVGIIGMSGVSALFDNNGTTTGIFRHMADPANTWEFKLVTFNDNFAPIANSVKTIADQGLNLQPTGILAMNNGYLLAHSNNDTTVPSQGEEDREIWLKLFTQDFELLQAIKLDDFGIHPTLATDGDKLYLAYSSGGKLKVAIFSVAQL